MPTEQARQRVLQGLTARRRGTGSSPCYRVNTWEELWSDVGRRASDAPMRLSAAASRRVLRLAIEQLGQEADSRIEILGDMLSRPGYRRHLRQVFDGLTRQGFGLRSKREDTEEVEEQRESPNAIQVAERALYDRYRELLQELEAEDEAGFRQWAARSFSVEAIGDVEVVALLEPHPADNAAWRVLRKLSRAQNLDLFVTLPLADDLPEAFEGYQKRRDQLVVNLGFEETHAQAKARGPSLLNAIDSGLFREDRHLETNPDLDRPDPCLTLLGAPRGEALTAVTARRVADLLNGADGRTRALPDDIVIAVPTWDDEAELLLETLHEWGLPAYADRCRQLA